MQSQKRSETQKSDICRLECRWVLCRRRRPHTILSIGSPTTHIYVSASVCTVVHDLIFEKKKYNSYTLSLSLLVL